MADKYDLTNLSIDELPLYTGTMTASDFLIVWDDSQGRFVKVVANRVTFA